MILRFATSLRSFFICVLKFRIGSSDQRARLAPTKAKGLKHVLALANPYCYCISLLNEGGQPFAIPETPGNSRRLWRLPQYRIDFLQLLVIQTPREARTLSLYQARPLSLKRRTQYSTVRGESPKRRLTSGQLMAWATSNTPWSRRSYRDSSERHHILSLMRNYLLRYVYLRKNKTAEGSEGQPVLAPGRTHGEHEVASHRESCPRRR